LLLTHPVAKGFHAVYGNTLGRSGICQHIDTCFLQVIELKMPFAPNLADS